MCLRSVISPSLALPAFSRGNARPSHADRGTSGNYGLRTRRHGRIRLQGRRSVPAPRLHHQQEQPVESPRLGGISRLHEFDAIAKRIRDEHAKITFQRIIVDHVNIVRMQAQQ